MRDQNAGTWREPDGSARRRTFMLTGARDTCLPVLGRTDHAAAGSSPISGRRVALLLVAIASLAAAACSPDDGGRAAPPTSNATTGTETTTTATGSSLPTTTQPTTTVTPPVPVPRFVDEAGFDDHSVPSVDTVAELIALARTGVGAQSAIKFVLPEFDRPSDAPDLARVHLMDSNFYGLHDEWYVFRLLNGQPIPGEDVAPISGRQFATMQEVYAWATALQPADRPLGLRFIDERLYASAFYDLAVNSDPRSMGVGTIVRFADLAGGPDHWLIELEYSDEVTPETVARFFERLAPALPDEVGSNLEWVIRSPQHDQVAQEMERGNLPFHDRIIRWSDLVPEGTVDVYSEGVAAGRLLYVGEDGAELGDATAGDIIVTERVPDWLPQAAALITSDPQTPLAHVNLLARNRGIPNASQTGVVNNAGLRQAARVRAHAIVIARGESLQVALISPSQYASWAAQGRLEPVALPVVDVAALPYVVDLTALVGELSVGGLTEAEVDEWRPVIGGKSAGFLSLLSTPGLTPPPDPLAITIRPYVEHLAPIRATIAAAITDSSVVDSPRARWLVLEGEEGYADLFPSDDDAAFAESFLAARPRGTPLGDVLAAGGVRALIAARSIAAATLASITDELSRTYAGYDAEAGLRFRSSSSVEDIEGFNGAGLYTSYTGYLQPERLDDPDDRDNTIERALLRAWGSYWSYEAFEERRLGQIDHLSGAMGLTVHARFDDDLERNNGVATFTFLPNGPAGGAIDDDAVLEINVQQGSVAVTNPDPDEVALPEVITVSRVGGAVTIERRSGSTLVGAGEQVLDDRAVRELFDQTASVAQRWRTRLNASLTDAQQLQTVVLDYEFKTMEAGWPQLATGERPWPARLVLRQVRSLDPGLRALPDGSRLLEVPRDVLMRATEITASSCTGASGRFYEGVVVRTDPLLAPDMGFSEVPWQVGDELPVGSACEDTRIDLVRYSSPRQALVNLVAAGDAFLIIGDPT